MINIKIREQDITSKCTFNTSMRLNNYNKSHLRQLIVDEDETYYKIFAVVDDMYRYDECMFVKMEFDKFTGKLAYSDCDCLNKSYDSELFCVHEAFLLRVLMLNAENITTPFILRKSGFDNIVEFLLDCFSNPSEKLLALARECDERNHRELVMSKITETKEMLEKQVQTRMTRKQRAENVKLMMFVSFYEFYDIDEEKELYSARIDFKVGTDKLYVVKDIFRFFNSIENQEHVKYGKFLGFKHSLENFEPRSRELIKYLLSIKSQFDENTRDRRYLYFEKMKTFFDLYDQFSDLMNKDFEVIDKQLKLELIVKKDEIVNQEYYSFEVGSKNLNITNNSIYKVNNRKIYRYNYDKVEDLLNSKNVIDNSVVASEDMPDFMELFVNAHKDVFNVTGDNVFEIFKDNIEITVYADVNDYREIELLAKVKENNEIHNLLDSSYEPSTLKVRLFKNMFMELLNSVDEEYNVGIIDEDRVLSFATNELVSLNDFCKVYISDKLKHLTQKRSLNLNVGVRLDGNLLKLNISADDINSEEIGNILKAYHRKKKYYLLKDGGIINFEDDDIENLEKIDRQLDLQNCTVVDGEYVMDKSQFLRIEEFDRDIEEVRLLREESFNNLVNNFKTEMSPGSLPVMFNDILRDYQKKGFYWLKKLENMGLSGILADDMGLGKTIQVIALLTSSKSVNNHSLVVCPSSLVYNWESEIKRFNPDLTCQKIIGNAKQRAELIQYIEDYDINIITYDMVRRDIDLLKDYNFHYVILDEAQYVKNSKTKNAMSVKKLKANHRLALTGTPIENTLAELWSIFDFLMPGFLFNHHYFQTNYEQPIVGGEDENVSKELKKLVEPFILRRNKKDVLTELPEKVDNTYKIDFDEEEWKVYLANLAMVNNELAQTINKEEKVNKVIILAMMTKLRQLCCDPGLLYEEFKEPGSKMLACLDLIESLKDSGKKMLLFSSFTSVLDRLRLELDKRGIKSYTIQGSTPKNERQNLVTQFQVDDTPIFLISLRAGGTGLNLTAAEAVIHYDPWWNMSAQNQATDRAHRIGQKNIVNVYKLIMKDSIEERILALQEMKKNLADTFVEDSDGSIASMSQEEILDLFKMPKKI